MRRTYTLHLTSTFRVSRDTADLSPTEALELARFMFEESRCKSELIDDLAVSNGCVCAFVRVECMRESTPDDDTLPLVAVL